MGGEVLVIINGIRHRSTSYLYLLATCMCANGGIMPSGPLYKKSHAKNIFSGKKVQPSKVESYLEVNP